jgi:hypothetical protein
LGVIHQFCDDFLQNLRLLLKTSFVVRASVAVNVVQVRVDVRQRLIGDFLEWNDEIGGAVECYQINPRMNRLVLDCFAVAFGMENFHELFDRIDRVLYFGSAHRS